MSDIMDKENYIKELHEVRKKELTPLAKHALAVLAEDLYANSEHYIYELLQNADDAQATKITFKLTDIYLEIKHNGKSFNNEDVQSITYINQSTKKDDLNTIGKFGAGFKSVFSITDSPEIYSGGYYFKITEYVIPSWLDEKNNYNSDETIIRLPFKNPKDSNLKIIEQLNKLSNECLLFLKHIKKITWNEGYYEIQKNTNDTNIAKLIDKKTQEKYLQFKKKITLNDGQIDISIAFLLDKGNQIRSINDAKTFVFFPVEKETTGLKFLVHAPYKTTASRESIDFDDEENHQISQELAKLLADSLEQIKKQGLLTVDFLALLPINDDKEHKLYKTMFKSVQERLKNEALLPTSYNSYAKADNVLLADNKSLIKLLKQRDCLYLFEKKYWLNADITEYKTKELYNYVTNEIEVDVINMNSFCEKIDKEFIKKQSDKWLIKFYDSVKNSTLLYDKNLHRIGILRKKPIIRLSYNNQLVCPENDEGNQQAYLPTGRKSKFKTVKKAITKNKNALEFLQKLGLKKPDGIAEIKEFIVPKYNTEQLNISKKDYLEDFKSVFDIWQNANEGKSEIIRLLKECNIIYCQDLQGNNSYQKAEKVYYPNEEIKMWFAGNTIDDIYFLHPCLQQKYQEFIKILGVNDSIKIIGKDNWRRDDWSTKRYRSRVDGFNPNLNIKGLKYAITNINIKRSIFLWQLLLNNSPQKFFGYSKTKERLTDDFTTDEGKKSLALEELTKQDKYWLYNQKSEIIKKPLNEILPSDLHDDYKKDYSNKLVEILGLKKDREKEIEDETGKKLITQEQYRKLEEIENKEKQDKEKKEPKWQPECDANNVHIVVDDKPLAIKTPDLSNQDNTKNNTSNSEYPKNNHNNDKLNESDKKDIGDHGEKIAQIYLNKKYSNFKVVNLNEGGTGEGYDFVIKDKNDNDIFYYEIKSKTESTPQNLQMTRTQWRWAKEQGDKYIVLLISNVGEENSALREYKNPYKLWQNGTIEAEAINIRL